MKNVTKRLAQEGLLEEWLASLRGRMADKLIPAEYRSGRILDVGCGAYPWFLLHTQFAERYGLDRLPLYADIPLDERAVVVRPYDLEIDKDMPFPDGYFDVVTMLAVFEHIMHARLLDQLREVRRVLKPSGMFVMTTPAPWADGILKVLSALKLVNSTLYAEHKDTYDFSKIRPVLERAGFLKTRIASGPFELFMNLWVTARK